MLGVQDGLNIRCVLGVGHFQIDVGGGQCIHGIAVLGEALGGLDDLGGSIGAAGREGTGLGDGLCALFGDTPVDEVGSGLCLGGIGVDGQTGHSAQRRTSLCTGGVRVLDDAPVELGLGILHVSFQRGNEPAAHVDHCALLVLKGCGVVQRRGLEVAVVHADAVLLLGNDHIVGGLHEVVFAVDDGVLAVQNGEQRSGGAPGVVVAAIDLGVAGAAGHLACQSIVIFHRQVIGGILHTGLIEQILVVVQHPEVAAEGHGVEVAVIGGQLLDGAVEIAGIAGQHLVQGLEVVQIDQVCVAGDILDGHDIQIGAAGQLGSQNGHVIAGAQIHHLDGHVLVACHVAVGHGLPVGGGLLIPHRPLQSNRACGCGCSGGTGSGGSSGGACGRAAAGAQGSSSAAGSGSGKERTTRDLFHKCVLLQGSVCISCSGLPRAGEPLAFADTRIPHKRKNRNGKIPGRVAVFLYLLKKDALSYTGVCTFLFSCTVYIHGTRKKRIKYTIFMKKVVDKPRRNQYCIKERMQNITGKEAPL